MSGLSGAQVYVTEGRAIKTGGNVERTRDQGEWIERHTGECLPSVQEILDGGYIMERLYPEPKPSLARVLHTLAKCIWTQPAEVAFDKEALARKLRAITHEYAPQLERLAEQTVLEIADGPQTPNLTHGDCTAENVMTRLYGDIVIIDPVPATPAVPDLREVDHGKMMQSALGWEMLRGNYDVTPWDMVDLQDAIGAGGVRAATPWCLVHLFRTLPYTTEEVHQNVIGLIDYVSSNAT